MLRKACARRRSTACHRTYRHASTSAIVGAGTTSKASSPAGAGSSASASTTMPFASSEQHASVILAEDGARGVVGAARKVDSGLVGGCVLARRQRRTTLIGS